MKKCLALALALILALFMTAVAVGEEQTDGMLECALRYVSRRNEVPLYSGYENENGELDEVEPTGDVLSKGDAVYVVNVTNDGYAKIRRDSGYAYVALSRLTYDAGAWYRVANGQEADAFDAQNGDAVGAFSEGDPISVVDTDNDWAEVLLSDGSYVYVKTAALKTIELSFRPKTLPAATVGEPYSEAFSADGDEGETLFFFSGTPEGIAGNAKGRLSGTPSKEGDYRISLTLKCGDYFMAGYATLAVREPLLLTEQTLYATVNVPFSKALSASGGEPEYTFSLPANSGIPKWLSLNKNGTLSGAPTQAGTYEFNVQVTDTLNKTASGKICLIVVEPVILDTFKLSIDNDEEVTLDLSGGVTGGLSPYAFSIIGNPPAGVSISGSIVTFKNVPNGSYEIKIQATDALMQTATSTISLQVSEAQTAGNGTGK